jgi:hypothetical protein
MVLQNPLKLSGYNIYHQLLYVKILHSAHTVYLSYMFSVYLRKTAIVLLRNRSWLVFITERESVLAARYKLYTSFIKIIQVEWFNLLDFVVNYIL